MQIYNDKEPFETDREYTIRIKKEGEWLNMPSWTDGDYA